MSKYQEDFSRIHRDNYKYIDSRRTKALKILSVLKDCLGANLLELTVLEIGCFMGRMSLALAPYFREYHAIDIDANALQIAEARNTVSKVKFKRMNAERLLYDDESFDIVICAHIYEHVPNPFEMINEIYRVLKPGGIRYFAASNKLHLIDPEYGLPFATMLPKKIANFYVQMFRGLPEYYETFMTLPALRKLVGKFKVIDYTKEIIRNPDRFHATDVIDGASLKRKMALIILEYAYWLSPTVIWILEK